MTRCDEKEELKRPACMLKFMAIAVVALMVILKVLNLYFKGSVTVGAAKWLKKSTKKSK